MYGLDANYAIFLPANTSFLLNRNAAMGDPFR